jgi:hypothetical protein
MDVPKPYHGFAHRHMHELLDKRLPTDSNAGGLRLGISDSFIPLKLHARSFSMESRRVRSERIDLAAVIAVLHHRHANKNHEPLYFSRQSFCLRSSVGKLKTQAC